jgi:serine protease
VEILSTANAGKTTPAEDNYLSYSGTSMAAPHVTGTIALMLAANPVLTPDAIRAKLMASVRPYPAGSSCAEAATGTVCGSGMLDAGKALETSRLVGDGTESLAAERPKLSAAGAFNGR